MPSPALTLGFIVATLMGTVFHMIFGGDARRMALLLLAGWVGFGLGHILGSALQIDFLNIGQLHIASAVVGALIALFVAVTLTAGSRRARRSSSR